MSRPAPHSLFAYLDWRVSRKARITDAGRGISHPERRRHAALDSNGPLFYKTASFPGGSAQVAQSVEQRTENPRVGGSIPPLGTILFNGLAGRLSGS